MHLSEAQPFEKRRPEWMAYKRREFFIDEDFARFLDYLDEQAEGPVELVLNGDIFDFDSITQLPNDPEHHIDWLARLRGLASEEWMSLFKMECIISDHTTWFDALGDFIRRGNRVVFVIGNHDVELHWPAVRKRVREALDLPPPSTLVDDSVEGALLAESEGGTESERPPSVAPEGLPPLVFCNWFYISEEDTYISHGHQYDTNCAERDPINPVISVHGRPQIRIPFGDIAGRYLMNGMGYFNPHAIDNYIMSAGQYLRFFFRYMLRTQPLLVWTWFWGAIATLFITMRSHWRPSMRDPLLVDEKVKVIARRARVSASVVRKLQALRVTPSSSNPFLILRELWLDRALLLLALLFAAWQIVLHINYAIPISALWGLVPLGFFLVPYFMYATSVRPTAFRQPLLNAKRAELIARITGVRRVVFSHTHEPEIRKIGPVQFLNSGFWSPAFAEPECRTRIGTQTFVWIKPAGDRDDEQAEREALLYEWPPGAEQPCAFEPPERKRKRRFLRRKKAKKEKKAARELPSAP